jgi:putative phage-type endonuclease
VTAEIIECKSREEWLAVRRTGVGASEVAAVLGLSPYEDALAVYARKVGAMPDTASNEAMEWGLALEPVIAEQYAKRTGRTISGGGFRIYRDPKYPHRLATLDREQIDPEFPKPGVLEVKTSGDYADDWSEAEIPLPYAVQVQHQLAVSGLTWGTIACLFRGQRLRYFDREPHAALQAKIAERIDAFWERVKTGNPPPASALSGEALAWLFPSPDIGSITLDPEADEMIEEAEAIQAAHEITTEKLEALKNRLRQMLGDYEVGITPAGRRVSWKLQPGRKAYTVQAGEPFRRFLIHKGGK